VCGGDGASCRHALTGRYAARTQFFAHQRGTAEGQALDLISKGSILSVVNIDAAGGATEHYCFLEMTSPDGIFIWSPSNTVQQIPDTAVALEERAGRFVRPLAEHRAYFGWSPERAPQGCVVGQMHSSGCLCGAPDALPTSPMDCRLLDIDADGAPGGSMYLDVARPELTTSTSVQLKLAIAALLNLEWNLGPASEGQVVGEIAGGLEQSVLGSSGMLAGSLGSLDNAMCDSSLGHVELVRGDFDCAMVLAQHSTDPEAYGIFDLSLDADAPTSLTVCQQP